MASVLALGALIATVFVTYGNTPAHAILADLYAPPGSRIVVERVNVVGRFAIVLSRGAITEGSPVGPILLERFSFGWQPLEFANFRCRLDAHGLTMRVQRELLRGMPQPQNDRPCPGGRQGDGGQARDIDAIRKAMHGPLVPQVSVADGFALGHWYGAGGGESFFRKIGSHWRSIASGGGALGTVNMRALGVPARAWCALGIYDAKCESQP